MTRTPTMPPAQAPCARTQPSPPQPGADADRRPRSDSRIGETGAIPARRRDPRVDVIRGIALLIIFIDHIPNNAPALVTPHNFGFSDAAEFFVLFAGYSAMVAYGGLFLRRGMAATLKRIVLRCARIYVFQAALLLATLLIVRAWMDLTGLVPRFGVAPLLQMGLWSGLWRGLLLNALPNYLDILPLYLVLLAAFPVLHAGMRRSVWGTLGISVLVWLLANLDPHFNLPNATADDGWYFNPFAWQVLFAIGMALAASIPAGGGLLPRRRWLAAACWAYLAFSCVQAMPWLSWGLPDLGLLSMTPPDKARVAPLRLLHILALVYLLFGSPAVHRLAMHPWLRSLEACGRHSLEVFALGCIVALIGRILYRTFEPTWPLQAATNLAGILAMIALARLLDRRARSRGLTRS